MSALGLQDAFLNRACRITRQRFLDRRGHVLLDVDRARGLDCNRPCAAIRHSDIHELLREGIPVRAGTTVTSAMEQGPWVHAIFDDGSAGDYDLVVGADGIGSWIRTVLLGGPRPSP